VLDLVVNSSRDDINSGRLTIAGTTVPVDLSALDFSISPFADPSRAMWWRSLAWLAVLWLPEGRTTPDTTIPDPIGAIVTAMGNSPDPGWDTPEARSLARASGWDEATNTRREQTLNCLFELSGDERLVPLLTTLAQANLDPARYYGPPSRVAHNHGTMANLALMDTAHLLGDAELATRARTRLLEAAHRVFTARGYTFEQSSDYLEFNVQLWTSVAALLSADPTTPVETLAALNVALARASSMTAHLIDPTGQPAAYGDSRRSPRPPPPAQRSLTVRDDKGGIAAGRWSWANRLTSWWSLRYGPPRRMHGHQDHGSVNWSTLGVPVLVDPGYLGNDPSLPLVAWQSSPAAHNVAVPDDGKMRAQPASSTIVRRWRDGRVDGVVVAVVTWAKPLRTIITVDDARRSLTLTTIMRGAFTTHLHLDPCWTQIQPTATARRFSCRGRVLTVEVGSQQSTVHRGSTDPIAGWVFATAGVSTPANELAIAGLTSQQLTLTVSRSTTSPTTN